ncbi:MAG: hypothetical protein IT290_00555, partial [Deltaproteobacteria bacterium]|nr:hypothetical protein [Deltaproteobacteria bacterium]
MATKRNSIPWKLIVRVTVSALLIYVVSRQINIMSMLSVVRTISLEMMFMLITLYFASQMINTFKWR